MQFQSRFTVLIERLLPQRSMRLGQGLLLAALVGVNAASAQTAAGDKVAADLKAVIAGAPINKLSWAKDLPGQRLVKVIIVAVPSADPELASLRNTMLSSGGSVYSRFSSVAALSGLLPATQVAAIAARADVQGISPNRMTGRTASALELMTGASALRSGGAAGYSGLDGSGVGIAVLDSGVMGNHQHFSNPAGASRIARSVNLLKAGDSGSTGGRKWAIGEDSSAALYPGSLTMKTYETKIAVQAGNLTKDRYGHGGHVAAVAAGRGAYQALDATGMAPNASLYDVKVLGDNGFGQMSDVLADSAWSGRTGAFLPTATLSSWLASASGPILNEGLILNEGFILSEGFVLSESGQPSPTSPDDNSLLGEP